MKLKYIYLLFLLFAINNNLFSQSSDNEMFIFSVVQIKNLPDSTKLAVIACEPELSVQKGMSASIFSGSSNTKFTDRADVLGIAKVASVSGSNASLTFTLFDSKNLRNALYIGDYVQISLPVKNNYEQSIFFPLIRQNIMLSTLYDKPLVDVRSLLQNNNAEKENLLIESIVSDIHSAGDSVSNKTDIPTISGGKFDGIALDNAMNQTNSDDVARFLRYIISQPKSYRSQTWRVSEIYAAWLLSQSPYAAEDLKQIVLDAQASNDWTTFTSRYKNVITPKLIEKWNSEASQFADNKKFEDAYARIDISILCAEAIKDTLLAAWTYTTAGDIATKENNPDYALEMFSKAQEKFKIKKNDYGIAMTQNNIASIYIANNQIDEAKELLESAWDLVNKGKEEFPIFEFFILQSYINRNLADTYFYKRKYSQAAKIYLEALNLIQPLNTAETDKMKAATYQRIADTYAEMGKKTDAQEYYAKVMEMSKKP